MKLNSNSPNVLKKSTFSKESKNKNIFNIENNTNSKIKYENQNSSFNNSLKNIWCQLNEKKSILI